MRIKLLALLALALVVNPTADARQRGGAPNGAIVAASPTIDGTTAILQTTTTTLALTLTTTKTNDVVIVAIQDGSANFVSSIADTASLSWTRRYPSSSVSGSAEEWYAKSTGILSGDVVTVTFNSANFDEGVAFGVNGANFTTPFDTNAAVPSYTVGTSTTYSTSIANDLIFCWYASSSASSPTAPTGFTNITTGANFLSASSLSVSTTQSGVTVTGTSSPSSVFVDAIQ